MPKSTINDKHEFFSVLETSSELQAALMTLAPGQSSFNVYGPPAY